MLLRDLYVEDSILPLLPDFTVSNYLMQINGAPKPYYKYISNKQDVNEINGGALQNLPPALFLTSLIPIFFHKRIPKLKNFTSKKARFLFGLLFLTIPITISGLIYAQSESKIMNKYQYHLEEFKRYRLTGDVTYMNPNIQFIKDL